MSRVLIAGCGDVGTRLGRRLSGQGVEVWGLRRDPSRLPSEIHPLTADLTDQATLRSLPSDLDLVFYIAAPSKPLATDPTLRKARFLSAEERSEAYRLAYVHGVSNLLTALRAQGARPRRVLLTSSTGVYSQDGGEWIDEDSPAAPSTVTGTLLREGEDLLLKSPFPATVVRLGGIYGPGRTALIERARSGEGIGGRAPTFTNRIHSEDAARLLAFVADLESPDELYLGVDCEPADRAEVLSWLARRLGVAAPAPATIPPASPASSAQARGKRCRNRRILDRGFQFLYPTFREGYAELVESRE